MKTNHYLKLGIVVLAACLLGACIDDKYDLDNVDMTIGTSGDLVLPESSMGDILLSNLLDVTDDGIVQVVDGEYFLVETGSANVPDIKITPVKIAKPELSSLNAHISIDQVLPGSARRAIGAWNVTVDDIVANIPDATYTYSIQPEDKAYYELPGTATGMVPNEIVSLDEVTFVDDTRLDLNMKIVFGGITEFITRAHLDDITLRFPLGLHVKEAYFSHSTKKDNGSIVEETTPAINIDNENGTIKLTEKDANTMLGENYNICLSLVLDKAVTGKGGFTFANHTVSMKGQFGIDGTFRIETSEFDLSKLTQEQVDQVIATRSYEKILPTGLDVDGKASFSKDIQVASFSGKVITKVGDIAPISLNDLPDFLNDPEVTLDLENPVFYVKVSNPLPAELKTKLTLVSEYLDASANVRRESDEIVLPANTKCVVCIAEPEHIGALVVPEKYSGLDKVYAPVNDLAGLLSKLPEAISVDIDDITADITAMSVPVADEDKYVVTVDYMVYTPLELGEGTKLVYTGVEENLSKDLEDVNKLDTKAIEIEAVSESNFPMNLKLTVDPQDKNGKSLVDDIVTVDDIIVNAHKGTEALSYQDIRLTIKPTTGHTIRHLLEKLDKFEYRAEATGDGRLLDNAHLKLTKIKITLKGGVTYDAN